MSLWLTENGIAHRRVFADTGWEHPKTYEYLRGPLTQALGAIEEVRGPRTMVELIHHKAMFPRRLKKFCAQELKVFPLAAFVKSLDAVVVNAVGIRAQESAVRAQMAPWEWQETFDCEVWRPLLTWSIDDVIEIHARRGLAPNPLYMMGASRVGCWPCINARKDEIRLVAEQDPGRIDLIRDMESVLSQRAGERGSDTARTFFQGDDAGIDSVVAWSKTAKGGKNLSLFQPGPPDEGCMRWGLCEAPTKEEETR